jgi:hypothetical protein
MSFEDVEDAIARTNDSDCGLGGREWALWLDMPFDVPFRGARQSAIGAENGQARIINVAL